MGNRVKKGKWRAIIVLTSVLSFNTFHKEVEVIPFSNTLTYNERLQDQNLKTPMKYRPIAWHFLRGVWSNKEMDQMRLEVQVSWGGGITLSETAFQAFWRQYDMKTTLLAESLRSLLDKSRKKEATLPTSSSSFDLPIILFFGWVRQVLYWINQFYQCTHTYSGVLLTLSAPTLHNKTNSCHFNFVQEFWENYRLNFSVLDKLENVPRFEMDFVSDSTMYLADFTYVNRSTIQ